MGDVITGTEESILEHQGLLKATEGALQDTATQRKSLREAYDTVNEQLRGMKEDRRQSKHEKKMSDTFKDLKRMFPGVRGRLVELCRPSQRQYNMAVTVATGKHMDAVVVDDYRTGQDCIAYLRERRLGSASFIPLDTIRVKPLDERLRNLGSNIKLVADVIDCEDDIRPAVLYAVSNTVVCPTMDTAR